MDKQNITKMRRYLETTEENKKGIDMNGTYAKSSLRKYRIMSILGYAKGKIAGLIGKDAKIIRSEEDAPYMTNINYRDRDNESAFIDHVQRGIKQESARRAIAKELKKDPKDFENESNE